MADQIGPDFTDPEVISEHMAIMLTYKQAWNLWHAAHCALDAGIFGQRGNHDAHCEQEVRESVQELAEPLEQLGEQIMRMAARFKDAKERGPEHNPTPQVMN